MLNSSTVRLMEYISTLSKKTVSIDDICADLKCARRTLYYNIHKLNTILKDHGFQTIELGSGILRVPDGLEAGARTAILSSDPEYVFSSEERKWIISVKVGISSRPVTVENLMQLLNVSRNTSLAEVTELRGILKQKEVFLKSHSTGGYDLDGDEIMVRNTVIECLNQPENLKMQQIMEEMITEAVNEKTGLNRESNELFGALRGIIQSAENCTSGQFSSNAVTEIAYYLCIVYLRQGKNGAVTTDGEISRLPEYRAAELVTGRMEALGMKIAEAELCYIATVMMGARLQQFNETYGNREPILSEFAEDLLRTFEQKALVEFPDKTRLKEQLMVHLRPMYYRLKYSIHVDHQFSGIMIQQYRDLYNLTDLAVKTVEDKYGFRVPAEEIAYLAIFFGSFVKYHGSREKSQSGAILIVCAAGVSSAMLIRQQLIFLLGSGYTYEICDKRHVSEELLDEYFLMVSAVELPFDSPKLVYVNAVLSLSQKEKLLQYSIKNEADPAGSPDIQDLLQIVGRYARVTDQTGLANEFRRYLNGSYREDRSLRLKDVFKRKYVRFSDMFSEWKTAVRESCRPLAEDGVVKDGYADDIIRLMDELGLYSEYIPGILLAHAKPGKYVQSVGIALTIFEQPIEFRKWDGRIKAVFVLATVDNHAHFNALQTLMKVLAEEEIRGMISDADGSRDCLDRIFDYFIGKESSFES